MRTSGSVSMNAVNHAAEQTLTPYRVVGWGAKPKPLARVELAHEDRSLGKHRAQMPRHSSAAAGKIEDSAKAGPIGCDHSSDDQIYRAAAYLQVVIKVTLKPANVHVVIARNLN